MRDFAAAASGFAKGQRGAAALLSNLRETRQGWVIALQRIVTAGDGLACNGRLLLHFGGVMIFQKGEQQRGQA